MTQDEKRKMIERASIHYGNFMEALGLDWKNNPHQKDTPKRVAKAFVEDLFSGLYTDPPKITSFPNTNGYPGMVFQGNIEVKSVCAHHHLAFTGKAYVAYIPGEKMVGLSKLNRVVEHYSRRPQVQEDLTSQIVDELNRICEGNNGIAVMIEANHTCASLRGVKHDSTMITAQLTGAFLNEDSPRNEFYNFVNRLKNA